MKIKEVLKVNEKVKRPLWLEDEYIMIQDDKFVGPDGLLVGLGPEDAFADDWQPYHEVKEIRPEKAGELWDSSSTGIWVTQGKRNRLSFVSTGDNKSGSYIGDQPFHENIIHGENGWERIFPKPEDDSVETIEIEGVRWSNHMEESGGANYTGITNIRGKSYDELRKLELPRRGPVKMILEIPKI